MRAGGTGFQYLLIRQRSCIAIAGAIRAAGLHPQGHPAPGRAASGEPLLCHPSSDAMTQILGGKEN